MKLERVANTENQKNLTMESLYFLCKNSYLFRKTRASRK